MRDERLRESVQRFDPALPLEKAWTPPASWYTDPEMYRLEQAAVFGANWLVAARAEQVDSPGHYVCGEIAGERYLVVRGSDGVLRAFYNVCRHHAAAVAQGAGSTKRFVCPYHGWTYGLDGRLINAPELGDIEDFDKKCSGLAPMAAESWGPWVYVALTKPSGALADGLRELGDRLKATEFESLRFVERRTYTLECNWKVYVDNYLDGGYHVAYLHRGLAAQLDLESYRTEIFDRFSIQSSGGRGGGETASPRATPARATGHFAARIGGRALYAWVYPNFMINRYGPIMDTNWIIPRGHERTEVIFDYYFTDAEGKSAKGFIDRSVGASEVVQQEDTGICEAVQRGLESRAYERGRYSPLREGGEYHFHRLLAADLLREIG